MIDSHSTIILPLFLSNAASIGSLTLFFLVCWSLVRRPAMVVFFFVPSLLSSVNPFSPLTPPVVLFAYYSM